MNKPLVSTNSYLLNNVLASDIFLTRNVGAMEENDKSILIKELKTLVMTQTLQFSKKILVNTILISGNLLTDV
jgi:hypothetical protein